MHRLFVVVVALAAVFAQAAIAAEPKRDTPRRKPAADDKAGDAAIRIDVRFSVKQLDPKRPGDSSVEVVVKNGTERMIRVPTAYATGFDSDIVLFGAGTPARWPMRLVHYRKKKMERSTTAIEPGKSAVIFRAGLSELLRLDGKAKRAAPREPDLAWSWQA